MLLAVVFLLRAKAFREIVSHFEIVLGDEEERKKFDLEFESQSKDTNNDIYEEYVVRAKKEKKKKRIKSKKANELMWR